MKQKHNNMNNFKETDWNTIIENYYKLATQIWNNGKHISVLEWKALRVEFFLYVSRNAPKSAGEMIIKIEKLYNNENSYNQT